MAFQSLNASFVLVIPNFYCMIVGTGYQIGFIASGIVIHAINTFFVTLQSEIWGRRSQLPNLGNEKVLLRELLLKCEIFQRMASISYFQSSIQGSADESIIIFRIYDYLHNVMRMSFEDLLAMNSPSLRVMRIKCAV